MANSITMATADLQIRPALATDTDRILQLVKLSLGEGSIPRHTAFWTWKHADNPFGPSPVLLAEAEGELVGLRVFMRWTWMSHGTPISAVRAVDTATHPDWRGRGIFSRLTLALADQMQEEGVGFVFNTPNDKSRPGYLKMGWRSVGRTSFWLRPLRPLRSIRTLLASRSSPAAAAEGAGVPDDAHRVEDLFRQPELPRFLEALQDDESRLCTPRSSDYLRWRYAQIPGFAYRGIWSFDRDDGAVIIFRSKDQGSLRELRLCEVLVTQSSGSIRLGAGLLRKVISGADADYVTGIAARRTPEQRVLLRCGFLPAPRLGPILTVRPLNRLTNGVDPLRRADWRASAGDLELF